MLKRLFLLTIGRAQIDGDSPFVDPPVQLMDDDAVTFLVDDDGITYLADDIA